MMGFLMMILGRGTGRGEREVKVRDEVEMSDLFGSSFRDKYVREYIEFCDRCSAHLNDWEREFITSIRHRDPDALTYRQFNKLKDIAERVAEAVGG